MKPLKLSITDISIDVNLPCAKRDIFDDEEQPDEPAITSLNSQLNFYLHPSYLQHPNIIITTATQHQLSLDKEPGNMNSDAPCLKQTFQDVYLNGQ